VIASGLNNPFGIAVDATNVYFTDYDANTVGSVPIDGGPVTVLAKDQLGAYGIAVDSESVYFAAADHIGKVPLGGGTDTTLVANIWSGGANGQSLAIDATTVYFALLDGTVESVPLGGGAVTTLTKSPGYLYDIALGGDKLYWGSTDNDHNFLGTIRSVGIGGGSSEAIAQHQNLPNAVHLDGTTVYFAGVEVAPLASVPVDGGPVNVLATSASVYPGGITVDEQYVYWTDWINGTLSRVPKGGGGVTVLASGQYEPSAVAVDATSIYWLNTWDPTSARSEGAVLKLPK
jgi:hypothetical protein